MNAVETRPYWQYVAVMDGRTRDSHRALHGKILRYDDPFWDDYFPPNGWGCRCRIDSVSAYEVEKNNLPVADGRQLKPMASLSVSPEWQYNPGKSFWQPNANKYSGWERKRIEEIVDKANAVKNSVEFIKNINYDNENEVLSVLKEQEKLIVNQDFESAVAVTRNGDVFKVNGDSKYVYLEALGDLKDAYVTHNHTVDETEYSFGKDDLKLFRNRGLKVFRGVDHKYTYELSRLHNVLPDIPKTLSHNLTFEDCIDVPNVIWAKENGFGYRRWINE